MDLRQLENMVAIEREQSISKAAERLFITQSALNQQLLKLEKEVGVPLFERRNRLMVPTYAGRVYLEAAHEMLAMKDETYRRIRDIAEEKRGEIRLAHSPEQGSLMFSTIYPTFHAQYPNVTFRIHEARGRKATQLLLQHEVTLACLVYEDGMQEPQIEYDDFGEEHILLAAPSNHPFVEYAHPQGVPWTTIETVDTALLANEVFVLPTEETISRSIIDRTLRHLGVVPHVLFETGNNRTVVNMVRNGQCLAFLPQSYAYQTPDLLFFSIPPHATWHRSIGYLKGTYLSQPEHYLIALIREHLLI